MARDRDVARRADRDEEHEGEELRDIEATYEHVKACVPDVFFTTVSYPIKGTPYHEEVAGKAARDLTDADVLRIANCSGFYGDRRSAAREMVEGGPIGCSAHSARGSVPMISSRMAMISVRCRRMALASAKRGSSARSGRPRARQTTPM